MKQTDSLTGGLNNSCQWGRQGCCIQRFTTPAIDCRSPAWQMDRIRLLQALFAETNPVGETGHGGWGEARDNEGRRDERAEV